ncbi:hypothetical protein BH10PSE17_BH10PSE17_06630 [soil metagenome]
MRNSAERIRRATLAVAVSLALCTVLPTLAQGPGPIKWTQLSSQQREALQPLEGEWNGLEPVRQQRWMRFADKYPELGPQEKQRVQTQLRAWVNLTPAERRAARDNYVQSRKWTPEQRQRAWERYSNLPPEERDAIAAEAQAKKPVR